MTTPFFHSLIALGLLLSFAAAIPSPGGPPGYSHRLTIEELQARQPLNGLPSNSNYTLVYTALGIGHQNYTCSGTSYVQSDPGDGASALLYDTTLFLETHPHRIDDLSKACNWKACKTPKVLNKLLGDHYFSEILQPTFNLTQANPPRVLSGVKSGDVAAPNTVKNIDWLYLTANPSNGISQDLKAVYRIDTLGGRPPTACATAGQETSIPYTAQYWFFD